MLSLAGSQHEELGGQAIYKGGKTVGRTFDSGLACPSSGSITDSRVQHQTTRGPDHLAFQQSPSPEILRQSQ
jgi:hypothetical protein